MKKKFIFLLLFLSIANCIIAQVKVRGYYRKNGTYVQPHYRSNPDGNPYNNYSYPGNTNPYTGKVATGNPDTYLRSYYDKESSTSNSIKASSNNTSTNIGIPSYSSEYNESNTSRTITDSYTQPNLSRNAEFNDYKTIVFSKETAYFYDEPTSNSARVNYVMKGKTLKIIREYNGFAYVLIKEKSGEFHSPIFGWIKEKDLNYVDNTTHIDNSNYTENYIVYPLTKYYVVSQTKAFFYDEPNDYSKRKAYLIKGEKITGKRLANGYIYTEFVNERGVTTIGWIREFDTVKVE